MKEKLSGRFTLCLLLAALGICIFGAAAGDAQAVFMKASTICMECIGLG